MMGEPFKRGLAINLAAGEAIREEVLTGIPGDKLFVVEFVGINAFAQQGQVLFVALQVHTNSELGIYPLSPSGISPYGDTTYPVRIFGSQNVCLYSDPNSDITVTLARSDDAGDARAFVDLSGRLVKSSEPGRIRPPKNFRTG